MDTKKQGVIGRSESGELRRGGYDPGPHATTPSFKNLSHKCHRLDGWVVIDL